MENARCFPYDTVPNPSCRRLDGGGLELLLGNIDILPENPRESHKLAWTHSCHGLTEWNFGHKAGKGDHV